MTDFNSDYISNGLSGQQNEQLAILSEACAEVIKIVCKIQRHGLYSNHPSKGVNNITLLNNEVGGLLASLPMLKALGILDTPTIELAKEIKQETIKPYLHFGNEC